MTSSIQGARNKSLDKVRDIKTVENRRDGRVWPNAEDKRPGKKLHAIPPVRPLFGELGSVDVKTLGAAIQLKPG